MKITYPLKESGKLISVDVSVKNKTQFAQLTEDETAQKSFAGMSDGYFALCFFFCALITTGYLVAEQIGVIVGFLLWSYSIKNFLESLQKEANLYNNSIIEP